MCKWPRVLGGVLGVLASPAPRPHAPRTRHTHTQHAPSLAWALMVATSI